MDGRLRPPTGENRRGKDWIRRLFVDGNLDVAG